MRWDDAEPVLRASYTLLEDRDGVTGEEVNVRMDREPGDEDAARAFDHLDRAGYINASFSMGFALPHHIQATEKGLQYCAGWPSAGGEQAFAAEFIGALTKRINDTDTPEEERGKLRRLRDATEDVGVRLVAEVIARMAEHKGL
jgi:hypothetical protein